MGILSKSQTIVRYRVEKREKEEHTLGTIRTALECNEMPEIMDDQAGFVSGWVPLGNPYDGTFRDDSLSFGSEMAFTFRIDQKKIPAKVLEQKVALAVKAKLKETGRDFLSRNEKKKLKEDIYFELMANTPFSPALYDIHWDYETGIVSIFTNQKTVLDLFETFFAKTFDRRLTRLFPYTLADGYQPQLRDFAGMHQEGELDMAVAYNKFKFLGSEFLAWLWWQSGTEEAFKIDGNEVNFWLGSGMTIENDGENGQPKSKITIKGEEAGLKEAATALMSGSEIKEINMVLMLQKPEQHLQFAFSVKSEDLCIKGLKTPPVLAGDDDSFEGTVMEKLYLDKEFMTFFDKLYLIFIGDRLGGDWDGTKEKIELFLKEQIEK